MGQYYTYCVLSHSSTFKTIYVLVVLWALIRMQYGIFTAAVVSTYWEEDVLPSRVGIGAGYGMPK